MSYITKSEFAKVQEFQAEKRSLEEKQRTEMQVSRTDVSRLERTAALKEKELNKVYPRCVTDPVHSSVHPTITQTSQRCVIPFLVIIWVHILWSHIY